jgi:hypothetical protein
MLESNAELRMLPIALRVGITIGWILSGVAFVIFGGPLALVGVGAWLHVAYLIQRTAKQHGYRVFPASWVKEPLLFS